MKKWKNEWQSLGLFNNKYKQIVEGGTKFQRVLFTLYNYPTLWLANIAIVMSYNGSYIKEKYDKSFILKH